VWWGKGVRAGSGSVSRAWGSSRVQVVRCVGVHPPGHVGMCTGTLKRQVILRVVPPRVCASGGVPGKSRRARLRRARGGSPPAAADRRSARV